MKRSVLVQNKTYDGLAYKSPKFDIPKCESDEQFFSLKTAKRKPRNDELTCSLTIDQHEFKSKTLGQLSTLEPSFDKNYQLNDALTTATQSKSNPQQIISFRRNSNKQKLNSPDVPKIETQNEMWKRYIPAPRAPVLTIPHLNKKPMPKPKSSKKWTIGDFQLIKKIGEGSYSEVFLAVEKATHFICAIKKISKKIIKQKNILHAVIRELKIHHYLNHMNITALYGEFDDEQYIYLINEFCTDGDLHKYLKQKMKLNEELDTYEVSQFVKQLCSAVAAMHKDHLMHRDIKPQNVFLTMGNFVKLGDFGWSVYYGDQGLRNTQCGTPLYLAPELVGHQQYTESVDIWAIGVLTYELLTGQIPFKIRAAKDMQKIISQNIKFEYIQDETARDFVMKLLERDSSLRMEIEDVLEHPFLHIQLID